MSWLRRHRETHGDVDASLQALIELVRNVDEKMDQLSEDARAVFEQVAAAEMLHQSRRKPKP